MLTYHETDLPVQPIVDKAEDIDAVQRFCSKHYLTQAYKRKKTIRCNQSTPSAPRWHNQSFMLYLALRQHTESSTMARTDLIKAALAWDTKLSEEHSLPKVFRGKTPMNSASAVLSNNSDGYFVPLKPEGSRSMHFKLSFEPGHFHTSWEQYLEWQQKLITMDWSHYFKQKSNCHSHLSEQQGQYFSDKENLLSIYPTEFDEFLAKRKRQKALEESGSQKKSKLDSEAYCSGNSLVSLREDSLSKIADHVNDSNLIHESKPENENDIPQSWKELFFVNNDGVFARRFIPKSTPIGFYFGVPRTEDEFEALKVGRGKAEEYAMVYRNNTIIDPTDDQGNLYVDVKNDGQPLCPFYYVKETVNSEGANIVFCEGLVPYQIVCWTVKDISPGEELYIYQPSTI
ncbi:hypothetical protein BDF20DRAFT_453507 [Mycotypha africana]|uniref:uncharacterized protein n=1 Tax=Mycotypha africana TaxID=64632 RepID=UPI00230112B7|nr:uncharacterized protein BDF20DRAFT_453507 [Mycotypha africana]KAI8982148.1 hypothetical protein BDF20DRAFT_453507 [Mycotypha africana]